MLIDCCEETKGLDGVFIYLFIYLFIFLIYLIIGSGSLDLGSLVPRDRSEVV
jgi:hypothetical protein